MELKQKSPKELNTLKIDLNMQTPKKWEKPELIILKGGDTAANTGTGPDASPAPSSAS
jgi:hypothetical protein